MRQLQGVRFRGLKLVEHWIDQETLVQIVNDFMLERGHPEFYIKIHILDRKPPVGHEEGWVSQGRYLGDVIQIFPKAFTSAWDFYSTLGHELDHLCWYLCRWEIDNTLPYRLRPHEARAFMSGTLFARRYVRKDGKLKKVLSSKLPELKKRGENQWRLGNSSQ